ncbi:YceI family protein [Flavobacterium ardleyense]|uniref:YceI family protein n=1 Tax=Flavobacterium ardleyense TaxID=2038737 RepID=A0ABW5ZAH2_9FLAO
MKKIALLFCTFGILAVSCKKEEKTEVPVTTEVEAGALKIVSDSTKVSWTAFKTTEKIGVGGSFTEISLKDTKTGTTPEAILEGATFSIPVSSLFTDNEDRDSKLKEFFFGVLKNKELINGTLNFKEGKCLLTIKLNDVEKQMEVTHEFKNNLFTINSIIDLVDFDAEFAVASINKACYELHKGKDGVSKTWNEVEISGSVLFE